MAVAQPEVTQWEPREALLAGADGLDAIRAVVTEAAARRLTGMLALEVGDGQAGDAAGLLRDAGYSEIATRRDLAGIERVVSGRR